ncbi:MAG: glycosyltransferase family 4 protein [Bacteroidales bacterium]|nr:glycosyltransferase family 4 protein [Bacteroidales bacterium]
MKKLCAISTTEGTLESFVIPAMRVFKERGYDVTLICTMSEYFLNQYAEEFHCINVEMKRGVSLKDMLTKPFEFYRIFKHEKFDYVQYATTNASFYACVPAKICGIKTRVYCQWGLLYVGFEGLKRKMYKWVEKFLCTKATHITVASKKNMEYAIQEGLMKADKATVVGDGGTIGVDLKEFDHAKRETYKAEVLEEYPVLKGKTVFGFVGRIETDKGINELLKAFLKIKSDDFALLLIGPFDALRSEIDAEALAAAKNAPNVIFHGFSREVPKYMSAMDILVHPTYREGFSMVIQQGMAMGCAVITTDVPGPSEVIEVGKSGLLVPAQTVDELAEAMMALGNNKEQQEQFAKEGLIRVREKFERNRMLELTYQDRLRMMEEN